MASRFLHHSTDSKGTRSSRKGFTLLETIIAVALMMIVTIIVYRGFMSSLQYSANTVEFERTAQAAVNDVNSAFSAGNSSGGSSDEGLFVVTNSGSYSQVLRVNTVTDSQNPDLIIGDTEFNEQGANSAAATNRHGFFYVVRPCTQSGCTGSIRFYKNGTNIDAMCDKCDTVYYTFPA